MRKWKNIWEKTIFRRLVLTFLLVILPIYLIGINIYNWGFRAIEKGITTSMLAQVSFYLGKLDSEIQRIKTLQNDCMADQNLTDLVYIPNTMSNFIRGQTALRLQYRLNAIRNSSNYVKDVKACIPKLDFTISGANGIDFYSDKKQDILNSPNISQFSRMVYYQGGFYLVNSYKSTYQNKILYWIEIPLDNGVFINDLKQFNTFSDSLSLMYCPTVEVFLDSGNDSNADLKDLKDSLKRQYSSSESGSYSIEFNHTKYYGFYYTSEYLGLTLAKYVPESIVLSPVMNYQIWLWAFLAMSFIIVILFSISIYNFIHKPLNILLKSFTRVEGGDLAIKIEHRHNDEFKHLYHSFNKMAENLEALIVQVYKQKILMQNAELKQLQAQIKPHFLYNSFLVLHNMAKAGDYDTVQTFLKQLCEFYKYISRSSQDEVPLFKEVEYGKTYANIQMLRFENRLSIRFDEIPDRFRDVVVPRFIIQPIIENSFKYGLEGKAGPSILNVSFTESEGCLQITIEDNGNGMNNEELLKIRETISSKQLADEVTGVVNIHRRLQLKLGGNSGLVIGQSELGGCKVIISIDLHRS